MSVKIQGVVYLIENLVNGKLYIGKTTGPLRRRWTTHVRDARRGSNLLLHRAIRRYGTKSFSIDIICQCYSIQELNETEKKFIVELKTHCSGGLGYNITWGGDGCGAGQEHPWFGGHHSEKTKKILSWSKKGDKNPSLKAAGLFHWNRGLVRSEETRARIRAKRALQVNTNIGMRHSEETKQKIREARARQAPMSLEARKKMSDAGKKGIAVRLGRWPLD